MNVEKSFCRLGFGVLQSLNAIAVQVERLCAFFILVFKLEAQGFFFFFFFLLKMQFLLHALKRISQKINGKLHNE